MPTRRTGKLTSPEWRVAAREQARAYKAWCSASLRDRRRCYVSFVDALVREELAARRVEHGASEHA